jgi:ribosome biogenesis GTPase
LSLADYVTGMIVREQSGFYWVEVPDQDNKIYQTRLRGKLMEQAQSSDIATIGDHVTLQVSQNEDQDNIGTIVSVAPRKSVLSRAVRTTGNRGAGNREREQVLIANADQTLFVFAAANPNPNFRMLDRFLIVGEASNIEDLVIVVNKTDLVPPELIEHHFKPYTDMGYPLIMTSAKDNAGIDQLRDQLRSKVSVFTGPSGVGKTSLLNAIQPGLGRAVKEVSRVHNEGMHTTRDSALVKLEDGGYIADTPGIRNLNIWDMEPEELDGYMLDVADYVPQCKFNNCTHHNEPGCAVRQAVKDGKVSKRRYKHYLVLRDELMQSLELSWG